MYGQNEPTIQWRGFTKRRARGEGLTRGAGNGVPRRAAFSHGLSRTKSISDQVHLAIKSACFGYSDFQKNGFDIPSAVKTFRGVYFRVCASQKYVPLSNEKGNFLNLQPSPLISFRSRPHGLGWRLTWFVIWTCSGGGL